MTQCTIATRHRRPVPRNDIDKLASFEKGGLASAAIDLAGLPDWMFRLTVIVGGPIIFLASTFLAARIIDDWFRKVNSG